MSTKTIIDIKEKRKLLSNAVRQYDIKNIETKVGFILNQFPETRNSDTALFIKYVEHFGKEFLNNGMIKLSDFHHLPKPTTITRARANIQNNYKLFLPSDEIQFKRGSLAKELRLNNARGTDVKRKISIYADESGKNEKNLIVGTLWVLSHSFFQEIPKMRIWKKENINNNELHFKKISKTNIDRYYEFVNKFLKANSHIGFKYLSNETTGLREKDLLSELYTYALIKGLKNDISTKRISLPLSLSFAKDKEENGYDNLLIAKIKRSLEIEIRTNYDNKIFIDDIGAVDSSYDIGLEIVDLFTGSINRILNPPSDEKNYKDEFADYFLDVVGAYWYRTSEKINDRIVQLNL